MSLRTAEGELIAGSVVGVVEVKTHVNIAVDIGVGPKLVSFIKYLVRVVRGVGQLCLVDGSLREDVDCEGDHNSEIVATTTQSPVELWVGSFARCRNGAIGKNDLEGC